MVVVLSAGTRCSLTSSRSLVCPATATNRPVLLAMGRSQKHQTNDLVPPLLAVGPWRSAAGQWELGCPPLSPRNSVRCLEIESVRMMCARHHPAGTVASGHYKLPRVDHQFEAERSRSLCQRESLLPATLPFRTSSVGAFWGMSAGGSVLPSVRSGKRIFDKVCGWCFC